jgi:predicted metallopeptidase
MIQREGFYLGWRWSQASGAVVSRCSGEATRCRQIGDVGVLRLGSDGLFSTKKETLYCQFKILAAPPLHSEVSKTCKETTTRWLTTTCLQNSYKWTYMSPKFIHGITNNKIKITSHILVHIPLPSAFIINKHKVSSRSNHVLLPNPSIKYYRWCYY